MKKKKSSLDVEQLKRWKHSPPESKFEWLAAALDFANVRKRILKKGHS